MREEKDIILSEKAPRPIGPYSQAVGAGGFIFVSGQIPMDERGNIVKGDIKLQTERVIENIKAILEAAGAGIGDVVRVTVYLKDLNDFSDMNEVYSRYFVDSKPSRVTVEVSGLPKGVRIEMSAIAYTGR